MSFTYRTLISLALRRPIILYHEPTWRCDCRCKFCDVWTIKREEDTELEPKEVKRILIKARNAGFTFYNLWGGEPLCYPGTGEITSYADQLGFKVIICTNGSRLEEWSREFAPHLHSLLVSIETVGERHDEIRGHKGLFRKAVRGIETAKSSKKAPQIFIWSNLSRLNMDQVKNLAQLAKDLKVYIEFFPANRFLGCKDELILDEKERREVFSEVIDLKRKKYPISNTYNSLELMKGLKSFRCNLPRLAVHMLWNGHLWPCEPRILSPEACYGNAQEVDLKNLSRTESFRHYTKELQKCNLCILTCVGHFSDNLWMGILHRFLNKLYYQNIYPLFNS